MTPESTHERLQPYLIYGSILMLLVLGGFILWLNYSYKRRLKKHRKPHLEPVSPPAKPGGLKNQLQHRG